MADKPRFSPTDTYVLDDTVIHQISTVNMTGIMQQLDEYACELELGDADREGTDELGGPIANEPRYDAWGRPPKG